MANVKPQFWRNDLKVIGLERETLERVLLEFREAVRCGIALVSERSEAPDINDAHVSGTIYNGDLGKLVFSVQAR